MGRKRTIIFTEEQEAWFKDNYASTANLELSKILHCGLTTIKERAKEYGLRKSEEYLSQLREESLKKASIASRYSINSEKSYENLILGRKKGLERLKQLINDKEWVRKRAEKQKLAIRKIRDSERRRVLFGLPQKTKWKLVKASQGKVSVRVRMRRDGYICDKGSNYAYYTADTDRKDYREKTAKKWGIKVLPIEMKEDF